MRRASLSNAGVTDLTIITLLSKPSSVTKISKKRFYVNRLSAVDTMLSRYIIDNKRINNSTVLYSDTSNAMLIWQYLLCFSLEGAGKDRPSFAFIL